jgi:hypothetical protein
MEEPPLPGRLFCVQILRARTWERASGGWILGVMNATDRERARRLIERIGLALNASHYTVTTDDPAVEPGETSWRIDNSKEIDELDELA